jgi:hypothetical protein
LLAKNREETLTPAEREEMEGILAISQVMSLAKAKARHKLVDWKDPRDLTIDEFAVLLKPVSVCFRTRRCASLRHFLGVGTPNGVSETRFLSTFGLDAATVSVPIARDISNRREDWYGDDGR